MFAKLAESLYNFRRLASVHPAVSRMRKLAQARANNARRKGLSSKGRDLYSALRNR